MAVWHQRPICEKHARYTYYHLSAECISAMLCDMPSKFATTVLFNLALYFMTNLRREPAAFFTYLLFCFTVLMAMSMFWRAIGSMSRTLQQSMVPFHGRKFSCTSYIPSGPGYEGVPPSGKVCAVLGLGSPLGQLFVDGTTYLKAVYGLSETHLLRSVNGL
ncbi:hypothetical protein BS50DRAFT_653107 [Corynespora cassiicola Philippines]|uniref:ABC-2 type transporter domain-containing protein n=1 Tax=Corynespora cassiicola Philippines TaxID=1448308 RepID=A0A2T2P5L5_CORCC|nr:hypothetical protein BS50DRAFT_653107 [Corynespora cassiicola Philippines]